MPERSDRTPSLTGARVHLIEDADPALRGVPDHVAASWRRSLSCGVDPRAVAHSYSTDLDLGSRLIRCAQPVIEQLAEEIAGAPMCVALTDDRARLLIRRDSDSCIGRALDRVYFARGFGYAEDTVGTNGVGTVLESGTSVQIVGAEHFVEPLQVFACAGAPIRDPFTGRIDGVLDISCRSEDSTPLMLSLVRSAAARIERNLLLDRDRVQQALFELYSRVDARGHDAVLAVGRRVVLANTAMQTLLGPADRGALEDHLRFAMSGPAGLDDRLVLPSGTPVRVRRSTVSAGGDVAGVVGVVRVLDDDHPPAGSATRTSRPLASGSGPAPDEAGTSPAWRAAAAIVEEALRADVPVVVLGEPGSGRATLLAGIHRRVHPAGRVVLVAAEEVEAAPAAVAERLLRAGRGAELHVLRDVDRLSPPAAQTLLDRLGGGARPVEGLAATAAPGGAAPSPLLAVFAASASVPPLRHRSADAPALVRSLLGELAPQRRIRLDDEAMRLVLRYRWPGNVRQLREALAAALRVRPVGCIRAQDLPTYCSSVPRTALRPVDEAERDAIVTALRATGGNRVAAAAELGLARSTLYRKIRHYGISV
ncbi:sigma-54-dependent Fis family transcriptional regulator [Trujillonella endophytica]|uniref:Transcriptional regulator of acetoin/glycerol metabolism n=1 Tax=Trujillonella endophytica TaxID=673521 RepID=A0A1H8VIK4_9ACTN|nr:helix-turn-helix domain-containing protein [Trujillella endophytica]SEP15134.1 Transcriptional regulator of acetoin/glycerol metabolism [Trujillella endophytica]